ncbi:GNAT family N-acetyltransferase [Myxococcus sp. K15C18031901]|uniref:GNAT family N-acetyltransferase n=1 Tax=Myxococcus dinghuensis TaxID=2906761 RepID=UPI0020A7A389|nr:GNAT family N-acetyltransferase [Myxococcus dinghuensis]MCP3105223.1 GNAT family N-acetyltransferase [Myxococcus dinghuensis]
MHTATRAEIDESHAQFRGAWRQLALGSLAGEVVERPEVFIAASHIPWALMNAAFLRAAADTEQALAAAVASAARYFATGKHPWTFIMSDDWMAPAVQERAESILAWYRLKPLTVVTGMVADDLREPVRPLPALDIRPVKDAWGRQAVADINAISYDMPRELGRKAFDVESMFHDDSRGFVACQGDAPASSTVVMRVDGIAYIALVATAPEHRKASVAETVMRRALAEARDVWGIQRTVLHATQAGEPVYRRMGYRPVTRFRVFSAPAPGSA